MKDYTKNYKEIRTLTRTDLRTLCINHSWYTNGTSAEFEELLSLAEKENISTSDIAEIAENIMNHSNDEERPIENYCFEIARMCNTFFEEA